MSNHSWAGRGVGLVLSNEKEIVEFVANYITDLKKNKKDLDVLDSYIPDLEGIYCDYYMPDEEQESDDYDASKSIDVWDVVQTGKVRLGDLLAKLDIEDIDCIISDLAYSEHVPFGYIDGDIEDIWFDSFSRKHDCFEYPENLGYLLLEADVPETILGLLENSMTLDEYVGKFKERYEGDFPEDFDWEGHIGELTWSVFG